MPKGVGFARRTEVVLLTAVGRLLPDDEIKSIHLTPAPHRAVDKSNNLTQWKTLLEEMRSKTTQARRTRLVRKEAKVFDLPRRPMVSAESAKIIDDMLNQLVDQELDAAAPKTRNASLVRQRRLNLDDLSHAFDARSNLLFRELGQACGVEASELQKL